MPRTFVKILLKFVIVFNYFFIEFISELRNTKQGKMIMGCCYPVGVLYQPSLEKCDTVPSTLTMLAIKLSKLLEIQILIT